MQLLAQQLELQQIRNCSKHSLDIHTSVRYSFLFDNHFASYRPDTRRDACRSLCEPLDTAVRISILNFWCLLHVSILRVHLQEDGCINT